MKNTLISNQKTIIQNKNNEEEYIIAIKKRKFPWWILLFLLPLLLLVKCEKDITFKVINTYNNKVESGVKLNFQYCRRDAFSFELYQFFSRQQPYPEPELSDTTDNEGIAVFENVKFTVYQYIFRNKEWARTFYVNNCSMLDTTFDFFDLHEDQIYEVYISPILTQTEFTVVDADDNNDPLVDATVFITNSLSEVVDSGKTDNSGKIHFDKIPFCSDILVVGSQYGFYNDTISGKLSDIYPEQDTLYLHQKKGIVKFYVKDCVTKLPIADAKGELIFKDFPDSNRVAYTNVKGKGTLYGEFNDIHIIASILIKASKLPFYRDSSTVNYCTVEEWMKLDEEHQTIYLCPEPNPILFQDIDELSKNGVQNVENTVTIKKSGESAASPAVVIISDVNGYFSISAGIGDIITIVAKSNTICPNEYLINDYTIVEQDYSNLKDDKNKRLIPLKKVTPPEVTFKDIEAASKNGIDGVENVYYVDGSKRGTITSNSDGSFTIKDVYPCEKISITASKTGYGSNSTKINNVLMSTLIAGTSEMREIPLDEDSKPEPPRENCRAYFTGAVVGETKAAGIIQPYVVDQWSELVGEGEYPDNEIAFPKAVASTFDGIAIDAGTRVIIYSEKNFGGVIVFDKTGPIIVNNVFFKTALISAQTVTFPDAALQAKFPPEKRIWSDTNMQPWSYGSVKVICE